MEGGYGEADSAWENHGIERKKSSSGRTAPGRKSRHVDGKKQRAWLVTFVTTRNQRLPKVLLAIYAVRNRIVLFVRPPQEAQQWDVVDPLPHQVLCCGHF